MWGAPSDDRTIDAGPPARSFLGQGPLGTRDHILLSQIRDFPNLEGQVPVCISPRDRVAQQYNEALGFHSSQRQSYVTTDGSVGQSVLE
jgi:hypothetical protein